MRVGFLALSLWLAASAGIASAALGVADSVAEHIEQGASYTQAMRWDDSIGEFRTVIARQDEATEAEWKYALDKINRLCHGPFPYSVPILSCSVPSRNFGIKVDL